MPAATWMRLRPPRSLARDSEWLAVLAQVAETVAQIGTHPASGWVYDALLPYGERYVVEGIGAAVRRSGAPSPRFARGV